MFGESIFTILYNLSFILSFIYLFVLISVFKNRISSYFIMLFAAILITNLGYMQMAGADNLKMAISANQAIYLGGSFTSFFLVMCLADICKTKIPMWLQILCIFYGAILFFFSSSYGITDLYYKKLYLTQKYGIFMLQKDYGPLHTLYPVYLLLTMAGGYLIIIKSFFNRKSVSYKNSILLMISMTFTVAAYIFEKNSKFEVPLIPYAYALAQTVVLVLLRRISMYDVGKISSDVIVETTITGIACFDSKGKFLGADNISKQWFNEIQSLQIDCSFNSTSSDFLTLISHWIFDGAEDKPFLVQRGNQYFQIEHSVKKEQKHKTIHCIFITDNTEDQVRQDELKRIVSEKTEKLRSVLNDIIKGLAITVENRDSNTGGHIQRTSDVVHIFADHLLQSGLFKDKISLPWLDSIVKAAYLHDFGKIGIPDSILNKPGRFEPDEFEKMKEHSKKGAVIVRNILKNSEDEEFKNIAENVAHYHHEKWNGQGYPEKISMEQIPFEARVMALADVFDALVSKRVYKESFSYDQAFKILEDDAGTHFDPVLTKEFLKCRPQLEALYNSYNE